MLPSGTTGNRRRTPININSTTVLSKVKPVNIEAFPSLPSSIHTTRGNQQQCGHRDQQRCDAPNPKRRLIHAR